VLFGIASVLIGLGMLASEKAGISVYFQEHVPELVINNLDTARNLVTTLVGGGISMLVFSFSMVMLLLNQAASNYSPRVLPSLISERRHQFVLGVFLGTIIYNILIMLSIEPKGDDYQVPGFSVLVGTVFAIVSLGVFVYFLHSISTSIQINHIMEDIHSLSRKRLKDLIENQSTYDKPLESENWQEVRSPRSSTLQNISNHGLFDIAEKLGTKIEVVALKGVYIIEGEVLFKSEKKLDEAEIKDVLQNFNFLEAELVRDNYILGFKQLAEIGVKAMSPGVNDPGTAIDSINYLTDLFALRMQKSDSDVVKNDDGEVIIQVRILSFRHLLYAILAPFRNYSKHDFTVLYRMFHSLNILKSKDAIDEGFYDDIKEQEKLLMTDARNSLENENDLKILKELYDI
jgi:uncharacterized membrane protein